MREDTGHRRLENGTIDYSHYRRLGEAMRSRTLRGLVPLQALIGVTAILATVWLIPSHANDCSNCKQRPMPACVAPQQD